MPDKTTYLRGFNTHFFDFLNDIQTIYPESDEIKYAITAFETIKRANPTVLIKSWHSKVYSVYKTEIDKGDITFFFEKDYSNDFSDVDKSNSILKMIDNIRDPIKQMNAENKEHSTKYIQNLSKLSTLYSSY
jgi:hypothetical protein|tara:strand:- start:12386 stop:12781 length:396 start_codon:yes stop_codon:yes gene_type:complete